VSSSPHVIDVDEASFQAQVIDRSRQVPVVVDVWAEWCGPCKTLGPVLEQAVAARNGEVLLAKIDADANPRIVQALGVQGIPAVKAFRDGQIVNEFTGAQPPAAVEAFLDSVVPPVEDREVARARTLAVTDPAAARAIAEQVLNGAPTHRGAALLLAELVLDDDPTRALELVTPHRPIDAAEAIAARAELALAGGDVDELRARVAANPSDGDATLQLARLEAGGGNYDRAVDLLLELVRGGGDLREPAREQLVGIFSALGNDHEVVRANRPRLAAALF
jgi:putative thioredoxin